MPTTIPRPPTPQVPTRETPPRVPDKQRPPEVGARRIPRWIQWLAGAAVLLLAIGSGLWFAARESGPSLQEQALEWPTCWPLCSAAAEAAAAPAELITPSAAPAELPDCWPLCAHAVAATALPGPSTAVDYPDCWPLCGAAARIEQAAPPICRPLCSYATVP